MCKSVTVITICSNQTIFRVSLIFSVLNTFPFIQLKSLCSFRNILRAACEYQSSHPIYNNLATYRYNLVPFRSLERCKWTPYRRDNYFKKIMASFMLHSFIAHPLPFKPYGLGGYDRTTGFTIVMLSCFYKSNAVQSLQKELSRGKKRYRRAAILLLTFFLAEK